MVLFLPIICVTEIPIKNLPIGNYVLNNFSYEFILTIISEYNRGAFLSAVIFRKKKGKKIKKWKWIKNEIEKYIR